MKKVTTWIPAVCVALGFLMFAVSSEAQNTLSDKADEMIAKGDESGAVAMLEAAIESYAARRDESFGKALGQYWNFISSTGDFARAYRFFSDLASDHPDNYEVLASKASAAGSYIGWIYERGLADLVSEEIIASLSREALSAYDEVLAAEPENFSALLGLAIWQFHVPGGMEKSKSLFKRLDQLRKDHPYYPWSVVDEWEAKLAPEKSLSVSGKITKCSGKHTVYIGIYDESFFKGGKPKRQYTAKPKDIKSNEVAYRFELPQGTYTVAAYEDENENGKLDMGAFGPNEPSGFCRKFSAWRAPKFEDVKFTLSSDFKNADIRLK